MFIQTRMEHPSEAKMPWAQICCESCWNAKLEKCVCKCGGLYHGLGNDIRNHQDPVLSIGQANPFLKQLQRSSCAWCGVELNLEIRRYPHQGGWKLEGIEKKQWLYIVCPKCKYQWALWKLGVPR